MKHKKRATEQSAPPGSPDVCIRVKSYTISWDALPDPYKRLAPKEISAAMERLYYESQTTPENVIPELERLLAEYPTVPRLYNLLSTAYAITGRETDAERVTLENLRRHPEYLFARLNYAAFCLQRGQYEEIARIFNHVFDLSLLYPDRKTFHITEFLGFSLITGVYFIRIGEVERARHLHTTMLKVAPLAEQTKQLADSLRDVDDILD